MPYKKTLKKNLRSIVLVLTALLQIGGSLLTWQNSNIGYYMLVSFSLLIGCLALLPGSVKTLFRDLSIATLPTPTLMALALLGLMTTNITSYSTDPILSIKHLSIIFYSFEVLLLVFVVISIPSLLVGLSLRALYKML